MRERERGRESKELYTCYLNWPSEFIVELALEMGPKAADADADEGHPTDFYLPAVISLDSTQHFHFHFHFRFEFLCLCQAGGL